jgi:hypothetical protein
MNVPVHYGPAADPHHTSPIPQTPPQSSPFHISSRKTLGSLLRLKFGSAAEVELDMFLVELEEREARRCEAKAGRSEAEAARETKRAQIGGFRPSVHNLHPICQNLCLQHLNRSRSYFGIHLFTTKHSPLLG